MKFYTNNYKISYLNLINENKLNAVYSNIFFVKFFKNGKDHNSKNAAYVEHYTFISKYIEKYFYLNGKCYGTNNDFTKQSWRKFVKLQVFL
jgi:hypothetical protein